MCHNLKLFHKNIYLNMKNKDAEKLNPCLKEQELTYKCFNDNDFKKEACQLHIENYKACKAFWLSVRSDRRRKGLYPLLPLPEDRDHIKKEYLSSKK